MNVDYEDLGEINRETPLEAFYEAMSPILKSYNLTAEFPTDKPSLAYSIYGIEHDILIGELPNSVRYLKWQGSPYANGGAELTLESETLVHRKTGDKLSFKIFISDYIRGMKPAAGKFCLTLKFSGEKSDVEAFQNAIAPVLEKYNFQSHKGKNEQVTVENLEEKSSKNSNSKIMTNNVNFDELAGKAFEPTATSDDFENLFAAAFSLPAWYFIADAEFDYKMAYCTTFPNLFGDEIVLSVFTDDERARKFIAEEGIKLTVEGAENSSVPKTVDDLILRISTSGILDFFDRLEPLKVTKIFFNSNKDSHGFHHDLKMMRPIYDHLENKGLLAKSEPETVAENPEYNLAKLVEENADVIADFEREHKDFSYLISASAAAMTMTDEMGKEQIISKMVEILERFRNEYQMTPKLFRVYVEACLNERKILLPVLAFAYLQQDKSKWQKLEQDTEFIDEYAKWTIKRLVPGSEILMEKPAQNDAETGVEKKAANDFQNNTATNEPDEKKSIKSGVNFDELSVKANQPNAPMEYLNELFGAAFALEKWDFVARGEFPNVNPYIAARADVAGGQQMVRAFTDGERLQRFAKENNLTREDGSVNFLSIPIEGIVEYLEQFMEHGVHGVWFNSDLQSDGFFIPIKQLRPIKEHLSKLNMLKTPIAETILVKVKDGLMLPSGFVSNADYACNFYARVPSAWLDGEQLKEEKLEKIYQKVYGETWRSGNSDGSRYVVLESSTKILAPEELKATNFSELKTTSENQYWFYKADETDELDKLEADQFQKEIGSELQTANTESARQRQNNLASWGISETPDGDFDLNLTINKVGTVNFNTSIAPFYEAIVPLLKDFRGTGDYVTLLRFEPSGKSGEVENIAENAHGAYLQIRRFLYLNPKNGVRIGVNSIHSSYLRHVQSNAELLVSIELCKNLDNQTGVFYHAFQGPKSAVLSLTVAIQPILESVNYEPVQ